MQCRGGQHGAGGAEEPGERSMVQYGILELLSAPAGGEGNMIRRDGKD